MSKKKFDIPKLDEKKWQDLQDTIDSFMKLFKETCAFAVICFVSCLVAKIAINRLTFKSAYLVDSFCVSFGATLGWSLFNYIHQRKNKK